MITLGIETSCDETAVALYDSDKGLIGEAVFSQIELHGEYGGVIPELASRDHCQKITHIYKQALGNTPPSSIDQIAYTAGPGLLGTLLIGVAGGQNRLRKMRMVVGIGPDLWLKRYTSVRRHFSAIQS